MFVSDRLTSALPAPLSWMGTFTISVNSCGRECNALIIPPSRRCGGPRCPHLFVLDLVELLLNIFTANLHKSNHHVGMWKYCPALSTRNASPNKNPYKAEIEGFYAIECCQRDVSVFQGCPHISRIKNINHVPTMLIGQLAALSFLERPGRRF